MLAAVAALRAGDALEAAAPELDRPTLTALGVRLPFAGDDNRNARVAVRFRKSGEAEWREALPLFRVRPESVSGWEARREFAGSIFDLLPATAYEMELRVSDPDGGDGTFLLTATTRAVPADPMQPRVREVSDTAGLRAALASARAGDIITLAEGLYVGTFSISAAGAAGNPIVIRGASQAGVVLDGDGSSGNVLDVYGAGFVHIERLTLRNANRGVRFQTAGAEGNVVRRVRIENTRLGIGSQSNQKDFYIADNVLEGRLTWPHVYTDDNGARANDDGIRVQGFGHVVCHNRITGYGDAMKTEQDGARAIDFYGNDVLYAYDNAVELDGGEGNLRCFRNRVHNSYAALSVQPVYGGPAYIMRNVVTGTVHEQMKFHGLGGTPPREPSGVFAFHNTFVSPGLALTMQTSAASHEFAVLNNLFVGAESLRGQRVVDWTGRIDNGLFDYNGYFPPGAFRFERNYADFAALQAGGLEIHGVLLEDVNADGIDKGLVLPNVNDGYIGAGPDLGAVETDSPPAVYGPRPEGVDEAAGRQPGIAP